MATRDLASRERSLVRAAVEQAQLVREGACALRERAQLARDDAADVMDEAASLVEEARVLRSFVAGQRHDH